MILLLVLAVCVIVRYRKKHNPSSVVALSMGTDIVHNNAATIAAAKKEKNINETTYNNPTYGKFEEKTQKNHYETDDNVYDEVSH